MRWQITPKPIPDCDILPMAAHSRKDTYLGSANKPFLEVLLSTQKHMLILKNTGGKSHPSPRHDWQHQHKDDPTTAAPYTPKAALPMGKCHWEPAFPKTAPGCFGH